MAQAYTCTLRQARAGTGRGTDTGRRVVCSRPLGVCILGVCTLFLSVPLVRYEHTKNVSEKKIGNNSCAHPLTLFSKSPTTSTAASD
jgi:hypothetical protein